MYRAYIAWKYITARIITFAAFLLVSLSVAILIILLGIMEGFRSDLVARIRGTSADLKVESTNFVGFDDYPAAQRVVESVPGVRATVPYAETLALYRLLVSFGGEDRFEYLRLQVLDLEKEAQVGELEKYLRNFSSEFRSQKFPQTVREALSREWIDDRMWRDRKMETPAQVRNLKPILLGAEVLPYSLNIAGLPIELTSISPVTHQPHTERFVVAGFFRSKDVEQDTLTVLMPFDDGVEFLSLRNPETGRANISGLRVFLDPEAGAEEVKAEIEKRIEAAGIPFVRVRTWRQEKEKILHAVEIEKFLVGIILGVIVIFVGLMIFIILTVQVVDRTRDLGILQALGAPPNGIVGIYLWIGGGICLAGIALGALYGWSFCEFLGTLQRWVYLITGIEVFPRDIYYIEQIPVKRNPLDFIYIILPTVMVSFLASRAVAVRASRKDPVQSLRYE